MLDLRMEMVPLLLLLVVIQEPLSAVMVAVHYPGLTAMFHPLSLIQSWLPHLQQLAIHSVLGMVHDLRSKSDSKSRPEVNMASLDKVIFNTITEGSFGSQGKPNPVLVKPLTSRLKPWALHSFLTFDFINRGQLFEAWLALTIG